MSGAKDKQFDQSTNRENYDATISDFLDGEIAALSSTGGQNAQSEDLDALVSTLLKQAIDDADAGPSLSKPPDPMNVQPVSDAARKEEPPKAPAPSTDETSTAPPAPAFSGASPKKIRTGPMLVGALCLCAIMAIGFGIPHLTRSKGGNSSNPVVSGSAAVQPPAATPQPTPSSSMVQPAVTPVAAPNPSSPSATAPVTRQEAVKAASAAPAAAALPTPSPRVTENRAHSGEFAKPGSDQHKIAAAIDNKATPNTAAKDEPAPVPASTPAPISNPAIAVAAAPAPAESASSGDLIAAKPTPAPPEKSPVQPEPTPALIQPPSEVVPAPTPPANPVQPVVVPRAVKPAELVSKVVPAYPLAASRARIFGTVVLDVQIDEQGKVAKATPMSGPPLLYPSATRAVLQWRFKPATVGGTNISSRSMVSIVFKGQ